MKKETKELKIIATKKGGAGKSTITYITAQRYPNATILDLDDEARSSCHQLAYLKPIAVTFIDPVTKRIDRNAFNNVFESIADSKGSLFIADAGASVSAELPKYLENAGVDNVVEILQQSNIDLHIVSVVGGSNVFRETMEYTKELMDLCNGKIRITIVPNGYYPMSQEQSAVMHKFAAEHNVPVVPFDLVKDKGELALRTVTSVMREGKGLSSLSPFAAIYFKKAIQEFLL